MGIMDQMGKWGQKAGDFWNGKMSYDNNGVGTRSGGVGGIANFGMSAFSLYNKNKNAKATLEEEMRRNNYMMDMGRANLGIQLNNMYAARNQESAHAEFGRTVGGNVAKDTRNAISLKYADKQGIVNSQTGEAYKPAGVDAAMGNKVPPTQKVANASNAGQITQSGQQKNIQNNKIKDSSFNPNKIG